MADSDDVAYSIASTVWNTIAPLIGNTYPIINAVDAAAVGETGIVPRTTVALSRPLQQDLETRLAAGKVAIAVETDENDAVVQQYVNEGKRQDCVSTAPLTIAWTQAGANFTLTGSASAGNIIGLQLGGIGATYVIVAGDTLATVAANLVASAISAGIAASAVATTITAPPATKMVAGAPSQWLQAVSRTARHFDVLYYCPDPYVRSYLVKQIEPMFPPGLKFSMPDGSTAVISARLGTLGATMSTNTTMQDNLFLARSRWIVDYTVTRTVTKAPIVAATVTLNSVEIDTDAPLLASQL